MNALADLVREDQGEPRSQADNRRGVTRWVVIRQACRELLFCTGVVILPALLVADTVVWLACRDLNRTDCVDLLILSMAQAESGEVQLNSTFP